ncbi:cellulose synthase complex periplasmic endoglucanase BcsZ [Pigmentiphaga humi]|nr:cellulose synthase complex periplasmic endoglucanase BcsZ [Pigmentiphaga humi]
MTALLLACAQPAPVSAQAAGGCQASPWPLWEVFERHFVQADGRVLDASTARQHSSSEGQSYGMFFALVAGNREAFDKMWRWSVDNLAGGNIADRLPAWYWGLADDGKWRVLDENSASDADLWFVYALLEAADRWRRPDYRRDALALLARIEAEEVAELPGLGSMLLPGRSHFVQADHLWQLNPSYQPLPVLRRLAQASPQGPWNRIADNSAAMLRATSPKGYVADWVAYRGASPSSGLFVADPAKGDLGSYDAIRTYMWAGMAPAADPLAGPMLAAVGGMAGATASTGAPPEKIKVSSGRTEGTGPFGFSAALVPYFTARNQPWLADMQRRRAQAMLADQLQTASAQGRQPPYYDVVLSLFGLGWADERYRFSNNGQMQLSWEKTCPPANAR